MADTPDSLAGIFDVRLLAAELQRQMHESNVAVLTQLFMRAQNVRTVASDSWNPLTILVPPWTLGQEPIEVLSESLDRSDVFLLNISDSTIAIGADSTLTPTVINRFDIPAGAGINLGTRGSIYAVTAAAAAKSLAIISSQWNIREST